MRSRCGSRCGTARAWALTTSTCTIRLRSPDALRRVLWSPGELGVARAFVAGDIEVDGDVYEAIKALRPAAANLRSGWRTLPRTAAAARRLGAIGWPLAPPLEEARPRGMRHSTDTRR